MAARKKAKGKNVSKTGSVNLGTFNDYVGAVRLDVDQLIKSRMLLQANSGGGKSWALRRILERTHDKVQQIVIDPEGEFYTLREKYDYVLCGKGGDCPAEPRSAALLARRLLELGCSAVIDIYELKPKDRVRFVRLFVEALVDAPKSLWRPLLVVIDEAHTFAPQKGEAESFDAVASLLSKGRKRGFCAILATQRMSKLHKDVAAEANNMIIGRARQDVDRKRAGEELGFTSKNDTRVLQTLSPGEFFAFGPAFNHDDVSLITIGSVKTSHPEAGAKAVAPAAPRRKIKALLAELSDLPAEADKQAKTVAELKAEVGELKRDIRKAQRDPDKRELDQVRDEAFGEGYESAKGDFLLTFEEIQSNVLEQHDQLKRAGSVVAEVLAISDRIGNIEFPKRERSKKPRGPSAKRKAAVEFTQSFGSSFEEKQGRKPASISNLTPSNVGLDGPMKKIIDAIAWFESTGIEEPYSRVPIAAVARYSSKSGSFNNALGRLRSSGLITYPSGGNLALTIEGRMLADFPDAPLTHEELHQRFRDMIDGPMRKILDPLIENYPRAMERIGVADAAGYSSTSGSFNNALGRLRSMRLIEYPSAGTAVACKVLFP